jgi:hypothetical protein
MAPVAGAVTDGEKNLFVFAAGGFESLFSPGVPVHRIVLVLEEVGGGFLGEEVGVFVGLQDFTV